MTLNLFSEPKEEPQSQNSRPETTDSPLQIKLITMLGLNKYFLDRFVFKRKIPKYYIRKIKSNNTLLIDGPYQPPEGYDVEVEILEKGKNSIPVCRLKPQNSTNNTTIIFAHGNASDMSDSLNFIHKVSQKLQAQYVLFDYSGYGESKRKQVGEEIICDDLQIVLAWVTKGQSLENIILWGFSLGTYPVLYNAVKHQVKAVILQCPIASIACFFQSELSPETKFKEDHFSNLSLIEKVKSKILIMHSSADEVIPFEHALLLLQKYVKINGKTNIEFLQVSKINHNTLHRYICSDNSNRLQGEVFKFIKSNMVTDPLEKSKLTLSLAKTRRLSLSVRREKDKLLEEIATGIKLAEIEEESDEIYEIIFQKGVPIKRIHRRQEANGCFCLS